MSRAQSGIEYIVVTGFALMALTPVFYMLYTSMSGYNLETTSAQASAIGREVFSTAERVWSAGSPSMLTIEVRVPSGLTNLTIRRHASGSGCTKCTEMVFKLAQGGEVTESTAINVTGTGLADITSEPGSTTYHFNNTFITPGTRRFTLEAFPDHVEFRQA
jgi:ABC-type glycerol-3-phosphate transport system permease component